MSESEREAARIYDGRYDVCDCGHSVWDHQSSGDEACMVRGCMCGEFCGSSEEDTEDMEEPTACAECGAIAELESLSNDTLVCQQCRRANEDER